MQLQVKQISSLESQNSELDIKLNDAYAINSRESSLEAEKIIEEALAVTDATPRSEVERVDRKLYQVLGAADAFLVRWRILCDKKGWLKK